MNPTAAWQPLPRFFRKLAAQNVDSVLLETAKQDEVSNQSLLFLRPLRILTAWSVEDADHLLQEIDRLIAAGFFVAGFFSYEFGEHLVRLPSRTNSDNPNHPLAWFGVYREAITFDHHSGLIRGTLPATPETEDLSTGEVSIYVNELEISRQDYGAALHQIQEYLHAGHTYQVNFTDRICGYAEAAPEEIYSSLLQQQPVSFAAYINRTGNSILSFSPEMFFRLSERKIVTRPMKGTWPRGRDTFEDQQAEQQLRSDEKNCSEHIMIVDLLRNDLGRICKVGSVKVEDLFQVERYRTLLQMTSTISGSLRDEVTASDILKSLFPSGSIVGAPKRRTMEIIRELEHHPREVYTGAIGYFGPDDKSCFSVAIRTLQFTGKEFVMGVGGGITADSSPETEYEECRLKANFLTRRRPSFSLIETMHCKKGIDLLQFHLERLANSAQYFEMQYDAQALLEEVHSAILSCGNQESRIRIVLDPSGKWTISTSELFPSHWCGRILLSSEQTSSKDIFFRHKTTHRRLYDDSLASAIRSGFDELIFRNEYLQITEGAISNIFLRVGRKWITPSLDCGLLGGVHRAAILRRFRSVEETKIYTEDIQRANAIYVCNALRGLRKVHSVETEPGAFLWKQSTFNI